MVENLSEEISQDVVCQHFDISKSTLYNSMYENSAMSLVPYLRDLRMKKAKELLQDFFSLKIKDVAHLCGIHDYNYFSRIFKKTFYITPRQYRKNMRNA